MNKCKECVDWYSISNPNEVEMAVTMPGGCSELCCPMDGESEVCLRFRRAIRKGADDERS